MQITRYFHIDPIPMDDDDYERFKKIGFYSWIFEQAEARNIMFDYIEKEKKPITKGKALKMIERATNKRELCRGN
jgi:hypothetical protein